MKISIWSDFVCPFCFIGETSLKRALNRLPFKEEVTIEYFSYILDPQAESAPGLNYAQAFARNKQISEEQATRALKEIEQKAEEIDLTINYDNAIYTGTLTAHRVFQYVKEQSKGNEFFEKMYQGHFVNGKAVNDEKFLLKTVQELGLSRDKVIDIIADPAENLAKVQHDVQLAIDIGVKGVPFMVINQKFAVPGAVPQDVLAEALEKIWNEENNATKK